jgi:hypothetical protein
MTDFGPPEVVPMYCTVHGNIARFPESDENYILLNKVKHTYMELQ